MPMNIAMRGVLFVLVLMCNAGAGASDTRPPNPSPHAENLSLMLVAPISPTMIPIPIETIDNSTGAIGLMLAAHPRRSSDPEILAVRGRHDAPRSVVDRSLVARTGGTLSIQRPNGESLKFIDWHVSGGSDHEGDAESFVFAGRLGDSGYLKINAFYQHDAPGMFLVNPTSGMTIFVDVGSDLVAVSTDQKRLVLMNNGLNPQFGVLVASLAPQGYNVSLRCLTQADSRARKKIIPFFSGWHIEPFVGLNAVLVVRNTDDASTERYEAIPVQFSLKGSVWHVSVPEPKRFSALTDLRCWQ